MTDTNKFIVAGTIRDIEVKEGSYAKGGGGWRLAKVTLDDVPYAGKKKDDSGTLKISIFNPDDNVEVGAEIKALCRAQGFEFNRDGEVGVAVSLSAEKVKITKAAPRQVAVDSEPTGDDDFDNDDAF